MWLIVAIIIGTILSFYPYYWWRSRKVRRFFNGPQPHPFIGTLYVFRDSRSIIPTTTKQHSMYGKTYIGFIKFNLTYTTCDTEFIEFVMTHTKILNKGRLYKYFHRWLGTGLLTSDGGKWQKRRKIITPAYHFQVLEQFVELFNRNGSIMIDNLKQQAGKDEFNVYPFVNLCALDTICETAMGTQVNAQLNADSAFVRATKEMNRIIMKRVFNLKRQFDAYYRFTDDYHRELKELKIIHNYTMSLIESRRDELIKPEDQGKNGKSKSIKRKDNFLDLLLKCSVDGKPLSNEDIREEVDTFAFEGHDTVSSAISLALYLISLNPKEQDRLIEEQIHIFGKGSDRPSTLQDLQEMQYLDRAIKETLRLYPSVPFVIREVSEDVYFNQLKIEANTQIIINLHLLHRDPITFPNPEQFIPDRFLPDAQSRRHPFSYLPFSAGFRNCIGQKFAMLEMKSIISKVLRNFILEPAGPAHEPFIISEVVLRSENGIFVKLKNRTW